MDVEDACKHLQIQLDAVEEDMLPVIFENARHDNPGMKTDQAIEAISKAFQKPRNAPKHSPENWPVGLTSHGNTCYLNSLLQYYFTIKPLRDIVLNFEDHIFDMGAASGKVERVGARKVKPFEIQAYQKFVGDLRSLFDRMIRDPGTAVKPEADLVCRAFLKAEEVDTRPTTPAVLDHVKANGTDLSSIATPAPSDRMQIDGMETAQSAQDRTTTAQALDHPQNTDMATTSSSRTQSIASSSTLNNESPDIPDLMTTSTILPPSPPASEKGDKPAPLRAPPLPPRNLTTPERQQTNLEKAEEAARQQQDVTEVMDEIIFRLRCAIKPKGMDEREEQQDSFRE